MQRFIQIKVFRPPVSFLSLILYFAGSVLPAAPRLSATDIREIRAVNDAYVRAWLNGDRQGVLDTFTPDAVIIPSGNAPISGYEAMKKFWWPDDGAKTTIKTYTNTIDEISGSGGLAYARGTSHLIFDYERSGDKTRHESNGVFLMILQKQADGHWRITRRMWTDLRHP